MDTPAISGMQLGGRDAMAPPGEAPRLPAGEPVQSYCHILRSPAFFILALAAVAAVLLLFPPDQYSFYPQCPIRHYLGMLCPGCGATRALAALLHGRVSEALRLNALTTFAIPLVAISKLFSRKPLRLLQPSPAALWALFAIVAAFTVVRNL